MNLTEITRQYEMLGDIKKCTIICCADHGVAEENVSAYPQETTAQMVRNYLTERGAAANAFADFAKSELIVVDVGVDAETKALPGIINRKIARGTYNITKGTAMTAKQAIKSIKVGLEIADVASRAGYNCFLPGEMGIGNTTSSAAVASVLLHMKPEDVTGRGTNISDERFNHKIEVVKRAIAVNNPNPKDPIEVLAALGGFEIGCITGIIIGAMQNNRIVIIDGFNTSVAALIACLIEPECRDYIIASHAAREVGQKRILRALQLQPILNLDLALGEAIGSSILSKILDNTMVVDDYDDEDDDDDDNNDDFDKGAINKTFDLDFGDSDDDDENFDIELNIYDGSSDNDRYEEIDEDEDDFEIDVKRMDEESITVTDRTFNFYLNTMPSLDKGAMDNCQKYIDNLSKPYGSLGVLEEIVVQIAGISGEDMPGSRLKKHLLCITDKNDAADEYENDDYDEDDESINAFLDVETTAEKYNTKLTFAVIKEDAETTEAFDFGRMVGEDLSFKTPIIGIAILNDLSLGEDIGDELGENLLTEDGKLKYDASEFLKYVPKERRCLVSGVIGAIISAAHNSSLLIVDTGAVDIIARYIEKLCPEVQPYILHASKLFIPDEEGLDDELDGEAACAAMEIVIAALYATNKMKSFNETEVNTAIDGIGASRQG